jgi:hypothetical protein
MEVAIHKHYPTLFIHSFCQSENVRGQFTNANFDLYDDSQLQRTLFQQYVYKPLSRISERNFNPQRAMPAQIQVRLFVKRQPRKGTYKCTKLWHDLMI